VLRRIFIGAVADGTIKVYDDPAAAANLVLEFPANQAVGTYEFNCVMRNGITIVTAASSKITVVYE